ncbi:MAG: zf-HC2 domain-containing protein [Terriglobales bacterium]
MKCFEAKSMFSPYLDGAVTGTEMLSLSRHLDTCADCQREYVSLRQTQQLLTNVGRRKAPDDLSLKLRLAISREVARARRPYFHDLRIRVENAIQGIMVPATVGLVTAVVIFGFLMGFLALPLQADNSDVPLLLNTAPQLQHSAFGTALDSIADDSLVIEAYVDTNGRVQDYRVLSSPHDVKDLSPQVKIMLTEFTTFRPATSMGRPTVGRAVLSFSMVRVKG